MEPRSRQLGADVLGVDPIPAVIGPTCVGKTELSIRLAELLDADVISADSRQIYRELTVGTAKPAPEDLARVPHHFINELSVHEPFSAGQYEDQANKRINQIRDAGRRAIVVGGSTLYLAALIHGLAKVPPVAREIVERLNARIAIEGSEPAFRDLAQIDPVAASRMDATKSQRIVRALAVYEATGRPLSDYYATAQAEHRFRIVVLDRPREELYARIGERVDDMLASGLVDEVQGIRNSKVPETATPLRSIGYEEVFAYLDGAIDHSEMARLIKRNTRRYAKRQITWFRRYPANRWIHADVDAEELVRLFGLEHE